jgi:hypothetical protein
MRMIALKSQWSSSSGFSVSVHPRKYGSVRRPMSFWGCGTARREKTIIRLSFAIRKRIVFDVLPKGSKVNQWDFPDCMIRDLRKVNMSFAGQKSQSTCSVYMDNSKCHWDQRSHPNLRSIIFPEYRTHSVHKTSARVTLTPAAFWQQSRRTESWARLMKLQRSHRYGTTLLLMTCKIFSRTRRVISPGSVWMEESMFVTAIEFACSSGLNMEVRRRRGLHYRDLNHAHAQKVHIEEPDLQSFPSPRICEYQLTRSCRCHWTDTRKTSIWLRADSWLHFKWKEFLKSKSFEFAKTGRNNRRKGFENGNREDRRVQRPHPNFLNISENSFKGHKLNEPKTGDVATNPTRLKKITMNSSRENEIGRNSIDKPWNSTRLKKVGTMIILSIFKRELSSIEYWNDSGIYKPEQIAKSADLHVSIWQNLFSKLWEHW